MNTAVLESLGLTVHESSAYVALLELKVSTAGKLADTMLLHRRTVYDTLNALVKKGLASYFEKNGVVQYTATSPERLSDMLEEKKTSLQQIMPQLKALQDTTSSENIAKVYQGIRGIKTIFEDILTHKEYDAFGEGNKIVEYLGPFFDYFQTEKKRKKIKARVLMGEQFRKQHTVTGAYSEFRFLKEYQPPVITYVYGDAVAILVWSTSPTAFVIESKETSDAYRMYFEQLWKNALV